MEDESVGTRRIHVESVPEPTAPRTLDTAGLQALIDALAARGYTVIGPTVSGGETRPTFMTTSLSESERSSSRSCEMTMTAAPRPARSMSA